MWRRRPIGITVLVVALIAVGALAWNYFSGPSSSDCAPVRELLAFNKTQTELLNSKTHIPEPGSYQEMTEPSDLDYRNWADGLADRAAEVAEPELASQAKDLAQTADRLVSARIDLNAKTKAIAPGAAPPPVAMAVAAFYEQFQAEVGQLSESCPT
jgi:hypothetical protein